MTFKIYSKYFSFKRNEIIAIMSLFIAILCFTTALFFSIGYFLCIFAGLVLWEKRKFVLTQDMLVLFVAMLPSILFSRGSWSINGWRIQFISVAVLIAFSILTLRENNFLSLPRKAVYRQVLLFLYYVMLVRCISILIRSYYLDKGYGFINGWHYVDFSVVVIFAFMLGEKLNRHFSALILAIAGWVLLEARMYKMYVILYYLFYYLLHGLIKKIKKTQMFNSYFLIIVWMILLSIILAYVWIIFIVDAPYSIKPHHTGLSDTSNYQRFLTTINGVQSILMKFSIFWGNQVRNTEKVLILEKHIIDGDGAHNTFVLSVQNFGLLFSVAYYYVMGRIFDRISSRKNDAFLLSYLSCCCILHGLLTAGHLFFLMVILILPWEETSNGSLMIGNRIDCGEMSKYKT